MEKRQKKGVELFSDLMLMKFKPKNEEGTRLIKQQLAYKRMEDAVKAG